MKRLSPAWLTLPRVLAILCAALAGWSGANDALAEQARVDLALVLAIDISSSISVEEHRLQLDGYAGAFRDSTVLDAIADGGNGVIAVTVLEWADTRSPLQSVEWTLIRDAASAERFASAVEALPYRPVNGTSIGSAIDFSHRLLDAAPFVPTRRVIDISGDGKSMNGVHLVLARTAAIAARITINGLPIRNADYDIPAYYKESVIGGPGAFLVAAEGFADFDRAIVRKLVLEIAGLQPEPILQLARD